MSTAVIAADVLARLAEHKLQFSQAQPFSHIVIDNFLDPAFCEALLQEFPGFDRDLARNENGEIGRKAVHQHISRLGPAYRTLDQAVQSSEFLDYVGELTSIPKLLHDPDYFGGGTHENLEGQDLDAHVDFTFHPKLKAHRRLNLIVYLNKEWSPEWGGNIQFHRNPRLEPQEDEIITVEPLFNRAVVFETHNHSWHGFERIALPDERKELSRKSVALYFYTREREVPIKPHSTIYVERHLSTVFKSGRTLDDDDVNYLKVLLKRRDKHLERLYGYITNLMQEVEHHRRQDSLRALEIEDLRQQHNLYASYDRDALTNRIIELENSTSWRLTAPLRWTKTLLMRIRRRLARMFRQT